MRIPAHINPKQLVFNCHRPDFLVVDDFFKDPYDIRELALSQTFAEDERYHKGARTRERYLQPWLRERFAELLQVTITTWIEGWNGVFQHCKAGDPLVVHSDTQDYAGVIYLTPDEVVRGGRYDGNVLRDSAAKYGTTFYRCPSTGLTKAPTQHDADRLGIALGDLEHTVYHDRLLSPEKWEVVDHVGNVFNRLVLWNSKIIHSATNYFGDAPENDRLFQLFFFNVEKGTPEVW